MKPCTIADHGVPKQPPGKGPNGRPFCRWCHQEVPKGRRSYCNDECWRHADFNNSKRVALQRDKNTCVLCGYRYPDWYERKRIREEAFAAAGTWRSSAIMKVEVDHIQAVKDGGSHHPSNLRTLCRACHKKRTAQQAAERAARRRELKRGNSLFKQGGGE